jgi:hypothetical protein
VNETPPISKTSKQHGSQLVAHLAAILPIVERLIAKERNLRMNDRAPGKIH